MIHEGSEAAAALGASQHEAKLRLAISGAADSLLDCVSFFDNVGDFFNFDSHFGFLMSKSSFF